MRNRWRVLAFDILAPVAAIAGLVYIGVALAWPLWWVSVCSVLCLLMVEGVVVNFVLARRDAVTVGTDDDGPGLRLAVVAVATAAVLAAVFVGYLRWTVPDRNLRNATAEVVGIASSVSEASATFTPQSPTASIDRATPMMSPEQRRGVQERIRHCGKGFDKQRTCRPKPARFRRVSRRSGRDAASVAVIMRGTQNTPGQAARHRGAGAAGHTVQGRRALARR